MESGLNTLVIYYFLFAVSSFLLTFLHVEHPEHFEQSHPQEVLPFILLIMDVAITPPTINTQATITIISIGCILFYLFDCFLSYNDIPKNTAIARAIIIGNVQI